MAVSVAILLAMLVPIAVMMDNNKKERRKHHYLLFFVIFNVPINTTVNNTITKDNDVLVLSQQCSTTHYCVLSAKAACSLLLTCCDRSV